MWVSNVITSVLIRERQKEITHVWACVRAHAHTHTHIHTHTHTGGDVKTERRVQWTSHQSWKGKEQVLLTARERARPGLQPGLGLPVSRIRREHISIALSHLVGDNFSSIHR